MLKWQRSLIACILTILLFHPASVHAASQKVTLQLKWEHQFQFAGYYAAKEQGYYKEAGLEVTINEAQPSIDPTDTVLKGEADFGVGTTDLVLRRAVGAPVVVLGVIFQHSPLALAAREDDGITNLSDLKGKKIMVEPQSAELLAYLNTEGITQEDVDLLPHTSNVEALIAGTVDAMTVYTTDELFALNQRGVNVHVFQPRAGGIDFYGDLLFTTESHIKQNPKQVQAFREASMRGWKYAMEHTDEMAEMILQKYSQRHSKAQLQYEASRMQILLQPELIDPGYFTRDRWEHIVATYKKMGMLKEQKFPMEAFLYHKKGMDMLPPWALTGFIVLLAILFPLIIITLYIIKLNRRLRVQIKKRIEAEAELVESEVRLKLFAESSDEMIALFNLDGRCIYFNGSVKYAIPANQLIGRMLGEWDEHPLAAGMFEKVGAVIHEDVKIKHEFTISFNNQMVWFLNRLFPVMGPDGQKVAAAVVTKDITERKINETKLDYLAQYDSLTGLLNRNTLYEQLTHEMNASEADAQQFALLFIDLDDFKVINDTYGHKAGDELLKVVAGRLTSSVRPFDIVMRLAGDEFVIILKNMQQRTDIDALAVCILNSIAEPNMIQNESRRVHASIGISIYPTDGEKAEELLHRADAAMYISKKNGSHTYSYYGTGGSQ